MANANVNKTKSIKIITLLGVFVVICLIVCFINHPTEYNEKPVNSHEYSSESEQIIISVLSKVVCSEEYVVADNNEKDLLVIEALYEIADKGTDEYPYPLIDKDSIRVEYTPRHIVYYALLDGQECYFVL